MVFFESYLGSVLCIIVGGRVLFWLGGYFDLLNWCKFWIFISVEYGRYMVGVNVCCEKGNNLDC